MKSTNRYDGLDPYVVSQIRYHARRLSRHPSIVNVEVEDLEQELVVHYLRRRSAFNPARASWSTFVDRMLTRRCATLVESACRQKRGGDVSVESLDQVLSDTSNADSASREDIASVDGASDLEVDFYRALDELSIDQFLFLVSLVGETISELAHRQGVHRSTVHMRVHDLRQELGPLKDYLH